MPGQIIKRGERTWLVRVSLGRDSTGSRRYHNRTVRGTKRDAERYRTKVLRELDTGTFIEPSDMLLHEFLGQWLDRVVVARVRPRTLEDYKSLVSRHIVPRIGQRRLGQLAAADIQAVYADLSKAGLSARSVRYVHSVLHNALEQAVRWKLLSQNPAKLVQLPRQERREMRALSAEESHRFLAAAAGSRLEALWVTLLTTGLRPGEALGLKWSDIRGDRLHIQRSLSWSSSGRWALAEPKTARARRVVTVPQTTVRALQAHRVRQHQERLVAGVTWEDLDLVFASTVGRPLEWRVVARRYFKPLAKSAGLQGTRPYDLRHSCATLLLAAGEHVKVVSERLGHASATLTLDVYSHVLPDMQQRAAERLETILFG